jgi:hypothetical protein
MKTILTLITIAAALAGGLSAADRWTEVADATNGDRFFLDYQSIEYHLASPDDRATVWEKTTQSSGKSNLDHLELNRTTKSFRILSFVEYGSDGNVLRTIYSPGTWVEVIPDSISEMIFNVIFPPAKGAK